MLTNHRELWSAFIAIVVISLLYFFVVIMLGSIPAASDFFGHSLGIFGFILMIMTEFLYTWRKRSQSSRWGRMSGWLQFHIFTGIVGPYLVLIHSSWKFHGLAGITMLLTVVIVLSGFIGRYIYTAVPRTADGVEVEASFLSSQIIKTETEIKLWLKDKPDDIQAFYKKYLLPRRLSGNYYQLFIGRSLGDYWRNLQLSLYSRGINPRMKDQIKQLNKLSNEQQRLHRQLASLALVRRLLSLWHAIHIPIGMVLFTAAFIHIIAAFYFATLLK